jgi:hypothetical protein
VTRPAHAAWNAGVRPRVEPAVLLPVALADIECRLRSGIAPDLEEARRLVATVRSLQRIVRQQAERVEDVAPGTVHADVEQLGGRG